MPEAQGPLNVVQAITQRKLAAIEAYNARRKAERKAAVLRHRVLNDAARDEQKRAESLKRKLARIRGFAREGNENKQQKIKSLTSVSSFAQNSVQPNTVKSPLGAKGSCKEIAKPVGDSDQHADESNDDGVWMLGLLNRLRDETVS
jgi:hypothetical protein